MKLLLGKRQLTWSLVFPSLSLTWVVTILSVSSLSLGYELSWKATQHNCSTERRHIHTHTHLHVSLSLVRLTNKYQRETGVRSESKCRTKKRERDSQVTFQCHACPNYHIPTHTHIYYQPGTTLWIKNLCYVCHFLIDQIFFRTSGRDLFARHWYRLIFVCWLHLAIQQSQSPLAIIDIYLISHIPAISLLCQYWSILMTE